MACMTSVRDEKRLGTAALMDTIKCGCCTVDLWIPCILQILKINQFQRLLTLPYKDMKMIFGER